MAEINTNAAAIWNNNKMLVTVVTVVVLIIIFMYFLDHRQQRAYELRRLEKRVELLEEWGGPRQNTRQNTGGRRW